MCIATAWLSFSDWLLRCNNTVWLPMFCLLPCQHVRKKQNKNKGGKVILNAFRFFLFCFWPLLLLKTYQQPEGPGCSLSACYIYQPALRLHTVYKLEICETERWSLELECSPPRGASSMLAPPSSSCSPASSHQVYAAGLPLFHFVSVFCRSATSCFSATDAMSEETGFPPTHFLLLPLHLLCNQRHFLWP